MTQHVNNSGRTLDLPELPAGYTWQVNFYPDAPYSKGAFWTLSILNQSGYAVETTELAKGEQLPDGNAFAHFSQALLRRLTQGVFSYTGVFVPAATQ